MPRHNPWAVEWSCDPFEDLMGAKVVETDSLFLSPGNRKYGNRLLGYKRLPRGGGFRVFYMPGAEDEFGGESIDLTQAQYVRRELPLIWLESREYVEGFAWLREFAYAAPSPSGSLHRAFGGLDVLAYSEVNGPSARNGRWYRRIWAFWHCPKCTRTEGVSDYVQSPYADIPVDPSSIDAGQESTPPKIFRVKGSVMLAAAKRRSDWNSRRGP